MDSHSKRARWLVLAIGMVAVAVAIASLPNVIERVAIASLRGRGVETARLRVASLGLAHLRIEDIVLGDTGSVTIESLEFGWTLRDLAARRLDHLQLEGLDVRATWREGRLEIPGVFDALFRENESAGADFVAMPLRFLDVRRTRLVIELAEDELVVDLALALELGAHGPVAAEAHVVAGDGTQELTSRLALILSDGDLSLQILGNASSGSLAWIADGAEGAFGSIDLVLEGAAPALSSILAEAGVARIIETSRLEGSVVAHFDWPGLSSRTDLQLEVENGSLRLWGEDVQLHGPTWGVASLVPDLKLRGEADGTLMLESMKVAASDLQFEGFRMGSLGVRANASRSPSGEWLLGGEIDVDELVGSVLAIPSATLHAMASASDAAGWRIDVQSIKDLTAHREGGKDPWIRGRLGTASARGSWPIEGPDPISIEAEGIDLDFVDGPSLAGLCASITLGEAGFLPAKVRLDAGLLLGGLKEAIPANLELSGVAAGGDIDVDAMARVAGSQLVLVANGRLARAFDRGQLDFTLQPVDLSADIFRRAGIVASTTEGGVDRLKGRLLGDFELAWSREQLASSGELELSDLLLQAGMLEIGGGRGRVSFDNLFPPSTPPGQRLAFDELKAGIEFSKGSLALQLEPDGTVQIEEARGNAAGGEVRARGTWSAGDGPRAFAIDLDRIGMGPLVEIGGFEELHVSGDLNGQVRLAVDDGRLALSKGRFAARAPGGRIAYSPNEAPAALAAAGDQGKLVLEALQDFHFEDLTVSLSGRLDDRIDAVIAMNGKSPRVESGRPIDLTIQVSTSFGDALRAQHLWALWVDALATRAARHRR